MERGLTVEELRLTLRGLVGEYGLTAVVDAALEKFQGGSGGVRESRLPWKAGQGPIGASSLGSGGDLGRTEGLTCQTCRWFEATTPGYGSCHLSPTRVGVEPTWWCRQYTSALFAQT